MNKKLPSLFSIVILFSSVVGCAKKQETVFINIDDSIVTSATAREAIEEVCVRNNLKVVDSNPDYTISLSLDSSLSSQGYRISNENKTISITGGDETGLLYGAYQVSESINLNNNIKDVKSEEGTPYLEKRGFRLNPLFDIRTPCYCASGDSYRAGIEDSWDIEYWRGVFKTMSYMRYNWFELSELSPYPTMVKVPGYEYLAIDDVWKYTGEYDDTYKGNCTNMFRPEHLQEGNYEVIKKITIDEKISYFQSVIALAHSYGIKVQFAVMNIYAGYENYVDPTITTDRTNEKTKDYFYKATKTFLETYDIDSLKTGAGENMDYPSGTEDLTEQYIYDVYANAIQDAFKEREDKKNFVFLYEYNELKWQYWKDFPYAVHVSTRYADTHMYAVTNPIYTQEKRDSLPDGVYDSYNLRNEDAYHFTWYDPTWMREFCKNMKDPKSVGFVLGSAGYYMGKEYEFVDESLNGGYYYQRHWLNYTMLGRFSYNPEMEINYFEELIFDHYREVDRELVKIAIDAITYGSKWLCEFQKLFYTGGTDSSWYPETCQSHPALFGYLDIKRFVNSDNAYGGSNYYSFAAYARDLKSGTIDPNKKTPLQVAETLKENAKKSMEAIKLFDQKENTNTELQNLIEDQRTVYCLSLFYSEKVLAAVNLRQYNDTSDTSYQQKALNNTNNVISYWDQYSESFLARFKPERFTRMGIVDPNQYKDAVKKDLTTIQKWTCRLYN